MYLLALLSLVALSSAEKVQYTAEQESIDIKVAEGNPYLRLIAGQQETLAIEYLQDITEETGLMIRVVFGDENGPLDSNNAEKTRLNLCQVLYNDMNDPSSGQARYSIAASLGLEGTLCPIRKGTRLLAPYHFPTEFETKDLGSGERYFQMRVETADESLEDEPILELHVEIKIMKVEAEVDVGVSENASMGPDSTTVEASTEDDSSVDNSSPVLTFPSVCAIFVVVLSVLKFTW